MDDKRTPAFSELMRGPEETRFCRNYFLGCADLLGKDGYTADAMQNGLVNAAFELADQQGKLAAFMTELHMRIQRRTDLIGDAIIKLDEERRKSAN